MYDPSIGRWLTEDPIDFKAGDPNLERYVGNDPTNATDPTGLAPENPLLPPVGWNIITNTVNLMPAVMGIGLGVATWKSSPPPATVPTQPGPAKPTDADVDKFIAGIGNEFKVPAEVRKALDSALNNSKNGRPDVRGIYPEYGGVLILGKDRQLHVTNEARGRERDGLNGFFRPDDLGIDNEDQIAIGTIHTHYSPVENLPFGAGDLLNMATWKHRRINFVETRSFTFMLVVRDFSKLEGAKAKNQLSAWTDQFEAHLLADRDRRDANIMKPDEFDDKVFKYFLDDIVSHDTGIDVYRNKPGDKDTLVKMNARR